jgi:hypothetical protein
VFASAGLLFLIEPLFAKMVLPRLGGTPAVWTTCVVFFQATLLAGYGYAHLSTRFLAPRAQVALQLAVLALPWLVLPIALPASFAPDASSNPIPALLAALVLAVGLPFFAAATSGPLLQRWFAGTGDGDTPPDPYFLYAASNAGSLLGLLAYPFVLEPRLTLAQESRLWTTSYALLLALTAACGALAWRAPRATATPAEPIAAARRLRWIALAAVPSSLMLGVTTHVTTEIGTVPLLWVVPLALYLATFVLAFARRPLVPQRVAIRALPIAVLGLFFVLRALPGAPLGFGIPAHLAGFFAIALALHGELATDRPPAGRLTEFYLLLALGGVAGGVVNALVAPLVFTSVAEYPVAIVAACFLIPRKPGSRVLDVGLPVGLFLAAKGIGLAAADLEPATRLALTVAIPAALAFPLSTRPLRFGLAAGAIFLATTPPATGALLHAERSFFAVHRVVRVLLPQAVAANELVNGSTNHGMQLVNPRTLEPTSPREALSYYHRTSPIGQVMAQGQRRHVAIVGLGTGSLAAYGEAGERFTFHEIDPAVARIAEDPAYFTFVHDARARGVSVGVVLGDARITIASTPPCSLDLLVLDAFSSDSIPVHLVTREAIALYGSKLAPHGLLAWNVSNRYLDLRPVLGDLAADAGLVAIFRVDLADDAAAFPGKVPSQWLVLARTWEDLGDLAASGRWEKVPGRGGAVWTDDHANVLGALVWR